MEQVKEELQTLKKSFLSRVINLIFSKVFIKQGIKFAIVGGIGTLVNLSILYIFTEIVGLLYLISAVISFITALVNNYILNKIWTFQEDVKEKIIGKSIRYAIICSIALFANLLVLFVLVEFFYIYYLIAEIGAIVFVFGINFIGNRFWTFRNKHNIPLEEFEVKFNKKIKRFVALIMAGGLFILGLVDVIIGTIKVDIVVFFGISLNLLLLFGILLIIIPFCIIARLIFERYFN